MLSSQMIIQDSSAGVPSLGVPDPEFVAELDVEARSADPAPERPWYFFCTWLVTPHIAFGAIYVGMIVVLFLDMRLLQSLIGIIIGTGIGALSHGLLTAHGARLKVPPIVIGRLAFGSKGN